MNYNVKALYMLLGSRGFLAETLGQYQFNMATEVDGVWVRIASTINSSVIAFRLEGKENATRKTT